MEEVFRKADISEGINVSGENLTNLRFADDVALFNEKTKHGKTLKQSELTKSESWLKIQRERQSTWQTMQTVKVYHLIRKKKKKEKVTEFKYLGQTTHLKDTTKEEIYAGIRAVWSSLGKKNKEITPR